MRIELAHRDALRIDGRWTGGSQMWYENFWQRQSGCGPTNAALMVWYLAQTRPEYAGLCDVGQRGRQDFLRVMSEMFRYVRPGPRGVNTAEKMIRGLQDYAMARQLDLPLAELAPGEIAHALRCDCPVAFLNWHSGTQRQLDNWHWMTIIAFDPDTQQVQCCDQGRVLAFSLREWQATSRLGGAFVALDSE